MAFDDDASIDEMTGALDRVWSALAQPGSFFSSAQRIDMTLVARARVAGTERPETSMPEPILRAVEIVAADAHAITGDWVTELEAGGLSRSIYLEILGVVALATAADLLSFGLGLEERTPAVIDGNPTGEVHPDAKIDGGWAPTVGPAFAHNALSGIPDLDAAKSDFSAATYLALEDISTFDLERDGLERDQIELVASRTSILNHCVF